MKSNKKDYLQIKNDLPNISLLEETAKTYYYLFTHKQPKDDFNHIFSSLTPLQKAEADPPQKGKSLI